MAELTTLARPYAKAAFEFALSKNALANWDEALKLVAQIVQQEKVAVVLGSPTMTAQQKSALVAELGAELLNQEQQNFVAILAENARLALLPQVYELFSLYKAQQEKAIEVELETAFELSSESEQQLIATLTKTLARDVTLNATLNKALIGGVVVRAGDVVIDESIRGRLAKLATALHR